MGVASQPKIIPRLGKPRLQFHRLFQGRNRVVQPSGLVAGQPQLEPDLGVARRQAGRGFQGGERLLGLPGGAQAHR